MVVESLFSGREMRHHPVFMFFVALLASGLGIATAYALFPGQSSPLAIAFCTIGLVHLILQLTRHEENAEIRHPGNPLSFGLRHGRVIKVFAWMFIGLLVAYGIWYALLPADIRARVFSEQEKTLSGIDSLRESLTGQFSGSPSTCGRSQACWFEVILLNNAGVLLAAVLLSFVWGAGAVFLIGWNASVLGVILGRDILALLHAYSNFGFFNFVPAFVHAIANASGLLPHGIFEATGYFMGSLAGGIISAGISSRIFRTRAFMRIALDALVLIGIALGILAIGAFVEANAIASAL